MDQSRRCREHAGATLSRDLRHWGRRARLRASACSPARLCARPARLRSPPRFPKPSWWSRTVMAVCPGPKAGLHLLLVFIENSYIWEAICFGLSQPAARHTMSCSDRSPRLFRVSRTATTYSFVFFFDEPKTCPNGAPRHVRSSLKSVRW